VRLPGGGTSIACCVALVAAGSSVAVAADYERNAVTVFLVAGPDFPDEATRSAREKELEKQSRAAYKALLDLDLRLYKAHGNKPATWPSEIIEQRKKAKADWDAATFAREYTVPKSKDLTDAVAKLRSGLSINRGDVIPLVERAEDAVLVISVLGCTRACIGMEVKPGGRADPSALARINGAFAESHEQTLAEFEWDGAWPVVYSGGSSINIRFFNRFSPGEPVWRIAGCDKLGGAEQIKKLAGLCGGLPRAP
jgi:hypothetical protein